MYNQYMSTTTIESEKFLAEVSVGESPFLLGNLIAFLRWHSAIISSFGEETYIGSKT